MPSDLVARLHSAVLHDGGALDRCITEAADRIEELERKVEEQDAEIRALESWKNSVKAAINGTF